MQKILHKPSTPNSQLKNFTKIYKLVAARARGARTAPEPPSDVEKRADEEEGATEAPDPARDHVRRLAKTLFYNPIAYSTKRACYTPVSDSKGRRADSKRPRCRLDLEPLTYLSDLPRVLQVSSVRCRSEGPQAFARPFKKKKVRITYPTKGTRCRSGLWNLEDIDGDGRAKDLQVRRQSLTQFENEEKPSTLLKRTFPSYPKKSPKTVNTLNPSRYKSQVFQYNLRSKTTSNLNRETKLPPESFMRYDIWNDDHSVAVAMKTATASPKFDQDLEPKVAKEFNEYTLMSLGRKTDGTKATNSKLAVEEGEGNKFTFSRAKHSLSAGKYLRKDNAESNTNVLSLNPTRSSKNNDYTVCRSGHSVKIVPKTYPIKGRDLGDETFGPDPILYIERTQRLQAQQPLPLPAKKIEEKKVIEDNDEFSICSSGHSVEFIPKSYSKRGNEEKNVPTFAQKRNDFTTSSRFGEVNDTNNETNDIKKENESFVEEGDDLTISKVKAANEPSDTIVEESPISKLLRQTSKRVDFLEDIERSVPKDSFSVCRSEHSVEIIPKTRRNEERRMENEGSVELKKSDKSFPKQTNGGGGGKDDEAGFDFKVCKNGDTVEIVPLAYQKRNGSDHNLEREEEEKIAEAWKKNPYQKSTRSTAYPPNKLKIHAIDKKENASGKMKENSKFERNQRNKSSEMHKLEDDQRTGKKSESKQGTNPDEPKDTPTPWIFQKKGSREHETKQQKPKVTIVRKAKDKKSPTCERFTLGNKEYSICKSGDTVEILPAPAGKFLPPTSRRPMTEKMVRPAREVYSLNAAPKKMRFVDSIRGTKSVPAKSWEFVISKSDHSIEIVPKKSRTGDGSPRTKPARSLEETVTQVLSLNLGEDVPSDCLVSRQTHSIGFTPTIYAGRPNQKDPPKDLEDSKPTGRVKYRLSSGSSSVADEVKKKLEEASKKSKKLPSRYSPNIKLKSWDSQKAEEYPHQLSVAPPDRADHKTSESADSFPIAKAKDYKAQEDSKISQKPPVAQQLQQKDTTDNNKNVQLTKSTKNEDEKEKNSNVTGHHQNQNDEKLNSEVVKLSSRIFNFYLSKFEKSKQKKQETKPIKPQTEEKYPKKTSKHEENEAPFKLTQELVKEDKTQSYQEKSKYSNKLTSSYKPNSEKLTPSIEKTTSPYKSQPVLTQDSQEEPKTQEKKKSYMSQPTLTKFKFVCPKSTPKVDTKTTRLEPTPMNPPKEAQVDSKQKVEARTEKPNLAYSTFYKFHQVPKKEETNEKEEKGTLYLKLLESYKVDVKSKKTKDKSYCYKKDEICEKAEKDQISVKNYVKEIEAREKKKEIAKKLKHAFSKPKNLLENYVPIPKEKEIVTEPAVPVKQSNTMTNIMKQYEFNERKTKGSLLMEETRKEVVNWMSISKVVSEALQKKPPSPAPKEPKTFDPKLGTIRLSLKPKTEDPTEASSQKQEIFQLGCRLDQSKIEEPKLSSCKEPHQLGPKSHQQKTELFKEPSQPSKPSDQKRATFQPVDQSKTEHPKLFSCKEPKGQKQETIQLGPKPHQPKIEDPKLSCKEPKASESLQPGFRLNQLTEDPKVSCKEPKSYESIQPGFRLNRSKTEDPKVSSCKEPKDLKHETIEPLGLKSHQPKSEDPKLPKEPKSPSKEIRINVATKMDNPLRFSLVLGENNEPPKTKRDPDQEEVDVNIIEANRPGIKKEKPPSEPDRKKKERPKSKEKDLVLPPAVVDKDLKLQQEICSMLKDLTKTVSKELLKEERETQKMLRELRERIEGEKSAKPTQPQEPKKSSSKPVEPDLSKPGLMTIKEKLYFQHLCKDQPQKRPKRPPKRKQLVVRLEKLQEKSKSTQDTKSQDFGPNESKDPILNVEKTEKQKLQFKPKRSKKLKKKVSDVGKKPPVPEPSKALLLDQKDQQDCDNDPKTASITSPPVMDRTFTTSSRYRNLLSNVVNQEKIEIIPPPKEEPSFTDTRRNLLHPCVDQNDKINPGIRLTAPEIDRREYNTTKPSPEKKSDVPDQCGDAMNIVTEKTPDAEQCVDEMNNVSSENALDQCGATVEKCPDIAEEPPKEETKKPLEIQDVTKEAPEAFENPPDGRWKGTREGYANKLYSSYKKYSYNDLETHLQKLRKKKD